MKASPQLYHIFFIVAQHKSMSSAAKALYISQPAISKAIRTLEVQLEAKLFTRKSNGILLTEEGKLLYDYVSKAMKALQRGEMKLEERNKSMKNIIKVGVSTSMCKFFLLKHLQDFQNLYPDTSIQIVNNSTKQTLESIDAGLIDIGINCFPNKMDNYTTIKLFDIHDIFVAHRDYITPQKMPINLHTLSIHPLILLHEDSMARESINTYFHNQGITLIPHMETDNMDFIIDCAKSKAGIACVIREFVAAELTEGIFVEIPLVSPPPTRAAGIIYAKEYPIKQHVSQFIDYLSVL